MFRSTLCAVALVLLAVSPASATLLFDNVSRANFLSTRSAGNSPLAAITVSTPTSIDQIGARVDLNSAGNLKFLIFDLDSHALLFGTGPTAYTDDGLTFKVSPVFADFALIPGIVYGIGAIADVGGRWSLGVPLPTSTDFTQNDITAKARRNGNVSNFAAPALFGDGSSMGIVQLYGEAAGQVVPQPATVGLLAAGVAILAATGCRLRRRS